ncbi:MAG: tetratricopeptide repeat protein [Spirochaetales bacterium]|nr:tetratricopeptide repeat protein [Spirochaetales bacterium]
MPQIELDRTVADLNNRAVSLIEAGRYQEAEGLLTKALTLAPDRPGILFNRAEAHRLSADLNAARADLQTALGLDPESAEIMHALGLVAYEADDFAEATKWYELALEKDPEYAAAWNDLGVIAFRTGRYEAAKTCFEKAARLDPDFADAWFNLADTCDELGLKDERLHALDMLQKARIKAGEESEDFE